MGDDDEEDSEDDEDEDSEAEELTAEVERDFFKTLASLKQRIQKFTISPPRFSLLKREPRRPRRRRRKKLTLADMERKVILEKGGKFDELEDKSIKYQQGPSYAEELKDIKDSFKEAVESSGDEDSDDDEDLLKPRQKSQKENEKEEEDYKGWLAGQKDNMSDKDLETSMVGLKNYWSNDKLDSGEQFLKDFLLNKRYLETADKEKVPTYDEIVHDSDEGISEDEKTVTLQEEFEHKFNFRFEDPDQEFIKRYPRTIKDSLRRPDDKRKKKRKEVEERKKAEKQQKMEDIKVMKSIKKKEILDKLQKLKKITGNEDMAIREEDIDGDFDPEEYDRRMKEIFDGYDVGPDDDQKPDFSDLEDDDAYAEELEAEDWDNWTGGGAGGSGGGGGGGEHCDDADFNMDCDYNEQDDTLQQELMENSKGRKKSRRRSKFARAVENNKPVFDPTDKTFEEYVDEYYKLDCEDVIGDLPCRFKYRSVEANDFGLSTEELLNADDKELNAWVSLRKTCQYRSAEEERRDVHVFKNKGKNLQLKKKILPSVYTADDEEQGEKEDGEKSGEQTVSKNKKKKNRKKEQKKRKADENASSDQQSAKKIKVDGEQQTNGKIQSDNAKPQKPQENSGNTPNKKKNRRRGKKKKGGKTAAGGPAVKVTDDIKNVFKSGQKSSNQMKKHKQGGKPAAGKQGGKPAAADDKKTTDLSASRLAAYGINPNKYNRMQRKEKYKNQEKKS